ncbi:hypothetical protein DCAR_0311837 [Daucus carota subsp. sativus]|nr:hypothetical protein DCAR_0311837 [Daucus carota subsp. sativus]
MLSDTAKSSGVNPKVAMSIPKRCNLAGRPVGYKCDLNSITLNIFALESTRLLDLLCAAYTLP